MWDASWLPIVPGLRVAAPRDPGQLRALLREAVADQTGPTVVRYPKAAAGPDIPAVRRVGHVDVLREDPEPSVLLVAVGSTAAACLAAATDLASHGVSVTVADPRWIAPLDPELIRLSRQHCLTVTVEDTVVTGSLGTRLGPAATASGAPADVISLALPPRFLPHDSRDRLLRAHGLDPFGITNAVFARLAAPGAQPGRREGLAS